jgi:peroxiredoxin
MPSVPLPATNGESVDLSALPGTTVLYIYPMTGRPDRPLPDGWDGIPGARGCTPQSCAFRDHFADLRDVGVDHLFGLSVQDTAYQTEAAERLHLPFPLLSDQDFALTEALSLPTFDDAGTRLLKRMSFVIRDGQIGDVIYPVFPPDQNAPLVLERLRSAD